jgi:hypothetical protein
MIDVLSKDDIRKWLLANTRRGQVEFWKTKSAAEGVPVMPLARVVGIHQSDIYKMAKGQIGITNREQARLSRFIRDWENGLLAFTEPSYGGRAGRNPSRLIHLKTPRPRAIRMSVSWDGGAKLTIAPRPTMNPRIPQFKDIFANLQEKR